MTYNVFGGTLNPTQSTNLTIQERFVSLCQDITTRSNSWAGIICDRWLHLSITPGRSIGRLCNNRQLPTVHADEAILVVTVSIAGLASWPAV